MTFQMSEKRCHTRKPLDTALVFYLQGEQNPRPGVGRDISLGGIFVETSAPARLGTAVVLHVSIPLTAGLVVLRGVVRWVSTRGMGLQFAPFGAWETGLITEIGRRRDACADS